MSAHRTREGNEQALRRAVIHSADAIPDEVRAYLTEINTSDDWHAQKQLILEYRPLIDYLAPAYTDFALSVLIERDAPPSLLGSDWHQRQEMGLRDFNAFFPPSHVRGPFLYLLRKEPELGLRLVNGLASRAITKWREYAEQPYYDEPQLHPLPTVIALPGGSRQLWGDARVYYWFRPNGMGPHVVASTLMALEVWMEERIAAGQPAEELFEQVLGGAECVAAAGVCLGVALAYPKECLRAALPLVSSPGIWRMDIERAANDQVVPPIDFGFHRQISEFRREREQRPQRKMDVRALAPRYLFFDQDGDLEVPFRQAVGSFSQNLPFLHEEERDDGEAAAELAEDIERYQACGDPDNYRMAEVDGGYQVWLEQPEHIRARSEVKLRPILEGQRWMAASMWALNTVRAGSPAEGMTLVEAVEAAKGFQRPGDFERAHSVRADADYSRIETIAGTAAAAACSSVEWTRETGNLDWCRGVLLAAAKTPLSEEIGHSRHAAYPMDPRVYTARGLGALVVGEAADDQVREALLGLVANPQLQVMEAVFQGLRPAWEQDPVLCWNALGLGLALCFQPRAIRRGQFGREADEAQWAQAVSDTYLRSLRASTVPPLPAVPAREEAAFLWDLAPKILAYLPLRTLVGEPDGKARLLQLLDGLMAWTLAENAPDEGDRSSPDAPYEWNGFFMRWAAALARCLSAEEAHIHVLEPVRAEWPRIARLTADLLNGYVDECVGFMEAPEAKCVAAWDEICGWVLDSADLKAWSSRDYLSNEMGEVVAAMVFVIPNMSILKPEWPHVGLVARTIEQWVAAIGHHPDAYAYLITFLSGPGWHLGPKQVVALISRAAAASSDAPGLWSARDNGRATVKLLQRLWQEQHAAVVSDKDLLRQYSDLVDGLVNAGMPVASFLQEQLERR